MELEEARRKLKTEAALEKVRAVALQMKEPADMLKICKTISKQLLKLGVKEVRNVQTAIFYESRGTYMNYEYYAKHDKSIITETNYNNNRIHKAFALKMLKGKGEFFKSHIRGKKVKDWLAYQKTTNVFIDKYLETASSLNYYWYSLGPVALGISTYSPLSEDDLGLFQRFLKVFELAYRRYLDIEKAVAQAGEARIQLALEKVRARTMAMQKSSELPSAANLLFHQVQSLGMPAWSAGYCIWNKDKSEVTLWMSTEGALQPPFSASTTEDELFIQMRKGHEPGKPLHIVEMGKKKLVKHYRYMRTLPVVGEILDSVIKAGHPLPTFQIMHYAYFSAGFLLFITYEPVPGAHEVFIRFAKVFDQTYTRFLDLHKAEAQAKEAQIEAALERVRSRTMAMHKSEELKEVIQVVYEQLVHLKMLVEHAGFILDYKTCDDMHIWLADPNRVPSEIRIPYFDSPHWNSFIEAKEEGKDFFANRLNFKEKNRFYNDLFKLFSIPDEAKKFYLKCPGLAISTVLLENVGLYIENFSGIPYSVEENAILMRFGYVFQQTYTRFLDLQKAEAQAREAKIEAALERTRTQSMLMQHSNELDNTLRVFHEQVLLLGIHSAFSFLWLPDEDKDRHIFWAAWGEENNSSTVFKSKAINYPLDRNEPATAQCLVDWKGTEPVVSYRVPPTGVENYFAAWQELILGAEHLKPEYFSDGLYYVEAFMKYGCFGVMIKSEMPEEEKKILGRFAIEFERTYTRFLDLQKAEAQAREAQIEAALERIRSRTIGMQRSTELQDAAFLLFQQIQSLGAKYFGCGFNIWDDDKKAATAWMAREQGFQPPFKTSSSEDVFFHIHEAAQKGESLFVIEQGGQVLERHYKYMTSIPVFKKITDKMAEAGLSVPTFQIIHCAFFSQGYLMFISFDPVPEAYDIFKRFAKVFDQTYTRFLDLQKAEAQARESQIELGLEKVRSRAMAMQKSDELKELIGSVFTELTRLDLLLTRCLIMIYDPNTKGSMWWMANSEAPADPIGLYVKYHEQPPYLAYVRAWENRTLKWQFILEGKTKTAWDDFLFTETDLAHLPDFVIAGMKAPDRVFLNSSFNNFGNLTLASLEPLSDEHFEIMLRFAKVFDLTYTRFNDLQKAEASAREAVKQASLDRVRAEIASMRSPSDLERITPLLWKELTVLGVPFVLCGVFIMDDSLELIHTYLSTPDGRSIAAIDIPYHTPGNIHLVLSHWRDHKSYLDHWDEEEFRDFSANLARLGALSSPEQYLSTLPPGGFYLHFLPFLQGMLYIGTLQALGMDELKLVQALAEAFSTAYARYEDFNRLEAAKQQVDNALIDLQLAQAQLVQAEKMASLGELTAGIAHEIQNPLNFVNNFSEVNSELIDEVKQALETGNTTEASHLTENIRQNLEKINFHGKRADAIVKSMLQHSRSSELSGKLKKEPTDINTLADEYLRLAYHGLRAKDQTFNAILKTDFDPSIGLIQVIPQDIARVILNLITNAFYAVHERDKEFRMYGREQDLEGFNRSKPGKNLPGLVNKLYTPTVTLTTKNFGDKIEIGIRDNGPGIPQHIIDKIFQPFFTTKPTGQGTGLGLSLAYDIVKAHGGELKVDTQEGEGSTFIMSIPNS